MSRKRPRKQKFEIMEEPEEDIIPDYEARRLKNISERKEKFNEFDIPAKKVAAENILPSNEKLKPKAVKDVTVFDKTKLRPVKVTSKPVEEDSTSDKENIVVVVVENCGDQENVEAPKERVSFHENISKLSLIYLGTT